MIENILFTARAYSCGLRQSSQNLLHLDVIFVAQASLRSLGNLLVGNDLDARFGSERRKLDFRNDLLNVFDLVFVVIGLVLAY